MTNPITTLSRQDLIDSLENGIGLSFAEEREACRALLAVMDARERPFMFAICNPDGSAWLDENCVADTENNLKPVLNDLRRDSGDDYYISPLYTTPPAPSASDGWIKCSDRMPDNVEGSVKYLVYETLNERVNHDYWNVPDQWSSQVAPFWNHYGEYVTHWMPLPTAPE